MINIKTFKLLGKLAKAFRSDLALYPVECQKVALRIIGFTAGVKPHGSGAVRRHRAMTSDSDVIPGRVDRGVLEAASEAGQIGRIQTNLQSGAQFLIEAIEHGAVAIEP